MKTCPSMSRQPGELLSFANSHTNVRQTCHSVVYDLAAAPVFLLASLKPKDWQAHRW